MTVMRETPKCLICGKIIAKAIYKNYKNYPIEMIPVGDSFLRWEYLKHKCKKKKTGLNKMQFPDSWYVEKPIEQIKEELREK